MRMLYHLFHKHHFPPSMYYDAAEGEKVVLRAMVEKEIEEHNRAAKSAKGAMGVVDIMRL